MSVEERLELQQNTFDKTYLVAICVLPPRGDYAGGNLYVTHMAPSTLATDPDDWQHYC
jgi:hypothetical protein